MQYNNNNNNNIIIIIIIIIINVVLGFLSLQIREQIKKKTQK